MKAWQENERLRSELASVSHIHACAHIHTHTHTHTQLHVQPVQ